ncbi:response regulator [Labrys okinawensis]|uniref:Response regulator n=1 Tax=Labrys okinawensis TaxID=346911 RepID=A0A2S9QIY2_9HYPH|nr:response regulator [Labrys okinawensis]PRH89288.1 response regulator [Labrys okinawensis]
MQQLHGMRLLIVEDEIFLAGDLADYFEEKGAVILGPAPTIEAAQDHVTSANAAILDVNINGKMVFPIADRLLALGIPFVFFSSYDEDVIPTHLRHVEKVGKSGGRHALLETLFVARRRAQDENETAAADPTTDVAGFLPELRLRARRHLHGKAAADRLVEQTLLAAIDLADSKPPDQDTLPWLCDILDRTFAVVGHQLLD